MSRWTWKEFRAECSGSALRRRTAEAVRENTLFEAVVQIRRFYLQRDPSSSTEYERGYGDCMADITRLLDPNYVPPPDPETESDDNS